MEEKLIELKEKYEDIKIPNQIDDYIMSGIKQAAKSKRKIRTSTLSTLAAGIMIFVLLASIRISPAFASYVSQVPGLERIVAFVQGDKGLQDAVKNDFIQKVGISDTHDGVTFTVDGIIADESRMIIFYTIQTDHDLKNLELGNIKIKNENNEDIIAGLSFGGPIEGLKKGEKYESTFDVTFDKNAAPPKKITVNNNMLVTNQAADTSNGSWQVSFDVDQAKFFGNEKMYPVNQTVNVEGQKITFKEVTVYPTKIAVHVLYDEKNTKKIFDFDDLKIVDENGEEYARINNGLVATNISDNERILYLQSNYFSKPKEMYLQFSSIRALDKDKMNVVVDLKQKKLIQKPNEQLKLQEVSGAGNMNLKFLLIRNNKFDEDHTYEIFEYGYYDVNGKQYSFEDGIGSSAYDDKQDTEIFFTIKDQDYKGPITLKLTDYPTRITKDVKIKVK